MSTGRKWVLVGVLVLAVAGVSSWTRRRSGRLVNDKLRGSFQTVTHPSGGLVAKVPAAFGRAEVTPSTRAVMVSSGSVTGGGTYVVIAVEPPGSDPFSATAPLPAWLQVSYLRCMMTALPGDKSYWWDLVHTEDIAVAGRTVSWVVSRNTVPLVSRVCFSATNKESDLSLRIFGEMTDREYASFSGDVHSMLESLTLNADRLRAVLGPPKREAP